MEFLGIILRLLGFDINLFARPEMKNRDIEFVLVNTDKYISASSKFKLNSGLSNSLAGPHPNNRIYDENSGLKGDSEDRIKNKAEIVNTTSKKDTNKAANQANVPFSNKNKKGSTVPKTKTPDIFSISSPDMDKISNDIGFGANGDKGFSASSAGKAAIVSDGSGAKGAKTGGDTPGTDGISEPHPALWHRTVLSSLRRGWCQWCHHPRPALRRLSEPRQAHCRPVRPAYHHAHHTRNQ